MNQIIEGIDNEVTLVLFFFTALIALVIPLYVLRPSQSNTQRHQSEHTTQENNERNSRHDEPSSSFQDMGGTQQHTPTTENVSRETNNTFINNSSINDDTSSSNNSSIMINIKIKHHETTQEQTVSSEMLLKDLKQKCFPDEVVGGKTIRMIFAGRILNGDDNPLHTHGISDGCVIHSVISDPVSAANGNSSTNQGRGELEELDFSSSFVFIYSFLIIGLWMIIFTYTEWFSTSSIVIFGFLTILGFSMRFLG